MWRSHGQEAKIRGAGGHRITWNGEAMGFVSPPVCLTGLSLIAIGCLIGATPRGQPWTLALMLSHGRGGLRARRMAVFCTFSSPYVSPSAPRIHAQPDTRFGIVPEYLFFEELEWTITRL